MFEREIEFYTSKIADSSHYFLFKKNNYNEKNDLFNDTLINKLFFLFEENLIDKESYNKIIKKCKTLNKAIR